MPNEDSPYLQYLDKEMTIMGILSTFCFLVLGFAIDHLFFDQNRKWDLWLQAQPYCMIGLLSLALSGFSFYKQRSLLAWYYGQISIEMERNDESSERKLNLISEADSWVTWIAYQLAFCFLFLAFCELSLALVYYSKWPVFINAHTVPISLSVLFFWLILYGIVVWAYLKYPDSEEPVKRLFS